MEIKISKEELVKRSIMVCTPMYGGACAGSYVGSLCDLTAKCLEHGIKMKAYFLFNESLITRARNYCVDEFLRSDFTHLMFIDSDIGFNADDVISMLALQGDETEYDIMCGPYPKKCISWEKIKLAVDKGYADENPNNLEKYVGDYVFNPRINSVGETRIPLDRPVEINEGGTGFMMIRRSAFTKYAEAFPELKYLPDHARSDHFDGSREITAYFDTIIDPVTRRYLSEDYMFCHNAIKIGMKVWLCPWMQLRHIGMYTFGGSLIDIATIGADPTAGNVQKGKK